MSEGLIRHLGFSTHGTLTHIIDAINTDEFDVSRQSIPDTLAISLSDSISYK